MNRKRSFPPVIDQQVRTLILGSLPGAKSLAHSEYYAHPQNRFWKLLAEVISIDLPGLPYAQRLQTLLEHGIGLWDVVAEAHRDGSLDSNIRDHVQNDLPSLVATLPQLRTIAFNGGTAARLGLKELGEQAGRYRIVLLPSSSPAYTKPYAEKRAAWITLQER
ncbi:G:T/U mismatch-specific uracil/thymine DNA-glycosylase [Collimonas arenae]|uniref:G:T/U mismatch-specific uracil/thymine DNA-glycosylase n=1 Tax=Collimonas arenae TaxID=279058 RepID=A0A0A1F9L8_9BURK|nr:DNA-deoxyinosine glycosylase [Collimonas arenae]AIY41201.1 G:T/U mismatch-specific uracil/thymine DNA-glycosylase [Collimonas arenae]